MFVVHDGKICTQCTKDNWCEKHRVKVDGGNEKGDKKDSEAKQNSEEKSE